ncbi:signal peptide peptidase-domain-containing protein [Lipomyces arxii]|uniref:signal peptide peptidase-domain-containing protein n=1 Tax=Lipomyces arxii TaxID=56418 RepID=UPI0034D01158
MDLQLPQSKALEWLEQNNVDPVVLTYSVLLVSAVLVIYCGSHATLHKPETALPADRADSAFDPADLEPSSSQEKLVAEDAYMMPVLGGIMLVGMYFLIKKLDKKYVEMVFNVYFSVFGVFAVGKTFASSAQFVAKRTGVSLVRWKVTIVENPSYDDYDEEQYKKGKIEKKEEKAEGNKGKVDETAEKRAELMSKIVKKPSLRQLTSPSFVIGQYKVASQLGKLPPVPEQVGKWFFTTADVLGVFVGLAVVFANHKTQHWILGNVLGTSFAFTSIRILTIDSFKTGYILLGGLFAYDVFFVFGTHIMVTVATSLTVPIKLTAPRPATASSPSGSNAMLGLGDIIVPAIFLSLCLRFDLWNFHRKQPGLHYSSARKFPKPFFHAGMVLYAVSLVVTIVVMHTFRTAQPALLYLCPGIGGAVALTALIRREWSVFWAYKEDLELEPESNKSEEPKTESETVKDK